MKRKLPTGKSVNNERVIIGPAIMHERVVGSYIRLRKGTVVQTKELVENQVIADFDKDENLLGVEVLFE